MKKILGFTKVISKKGTRCCFVGTAEPLTENERQNGGAGQKIDVVSVFGDLVDKVTPDLVGKEVQFLYNVSGSRAFLTDIVVMPSGK